MKTILIIEDNDEIRENTVELLELEKFNVIAASNGHDGITAALGITPDLILCDIMMPELDGLTVFSILNEHPLTKGVPFIFLTAKSELSDKNEAMKLGVDDYVIKPYDPESLVTTIRNRIEKHLKIKKESEYQLTDYVKELEDMLFMTSHEVRAPLCRCQGIINVIENKDLVDGDDINKLLASIKTSLSEMDKFTRNLTDFLNEARKKKIEKLSKNVFNVGHNKQSNI